MGRCPCACAMAALYFYVCFTLKLTLVAGQPVLYVLKGKEAILSPALSNAPEDIRWKHNGDKVITFDSAEEHVFSPYDGRVTLGWDTAELTIADVGYEDSGEYELNAFIRNKPHRSQYMLKVLDKVSRPVIQCEMNDESGNSTSVRRATLLCSSDSNTPETLTFKWNLDGKSQLGQALTISLGNELDLMEYSCTATNPVHSETSVFTAKDCYTEKSSKALDVFVPIVIALLILLAFCIFPFIFRHQIKRACLKQTRSTIDDLEKQTAVADYNNENEGRPLMRNNIHRQETFASNQPLIEQNDNVAVTPQKGKENETDIGEVATSQPASPRNGQVDLDLFQKEQDSVPKSEGGSDADLNQSIENHDASKELDHEEVGKTGHSSSVHSGHLEATGAPEQGDSPPQSPYQSNEPVLHQVSESEPVNSENKEQTHPEKSTLAPVVSDPLTENNGTSGHKTTGASELLSDLQTAPETPSQSPSQSKPTAEKDSQSGTLEDEEKSDPNNESNTVDKKTQRGPSHYTTTECGESEQTNEQQSLSEAESSDRNQNLTSESSVEEAKDQEKPKSSTDRKLHKQDSSSEESQELKQTSTTEKTSTIDSKPSMKRFINNGPQSQPPSSDPQDLQPKPGEHESKGQTDSQEEPDVNHSDCEDVRETHGDSSSIQTGQEEATDAPRHAGSEKESDESTHPPASALIQAAHNKRSKDTDAENASSAQVSEETKDNTDKGSDSSSSEQINEASKSNQGQQQS